MMAWKKAQAEYLLDLAALCREWVQQGKKNQALTDLNAWLQTRTKEDLEPLHLHTKPEYLPRSCWDWGWPLNRFKKCGGEVPMLELLAEYCAEKQTEGKTPKDAAVRIMTELQNWHKTVSFSLAAQYQMEEDPDTALKPEELEQYLALKKGPKKQKRDMSLLDKYVNRHFQGLAAGQHTSRELSRWGNQNSFYMISARALADRTAAKPEAEGGNGRFCPPEQVLDVPRLALLWKLLSEDTQNWTALSADSWGWYKGSDPGKDLQNMLLFYGEPPVQEPEEENTPAADERGESFGDPAQDQGEPPRLDYRLYRGDRHFAPLTVARPRPTDGGVDLSAWRDLPGTVPYQWLKEAAGICKNADMAREALNRLPEWGEKKEEITAQLLESQILRDERKAERKEQTERWMELEAALWALYPYRDVKQSERKKEERKPPLDWLVSLTPEKDTDNSERTLDLSNIPKEDRAQNAPEGETKKPDKHFRDALFNWSCDSDTAMLQEWSAERNGDVFILRSCGPRVYTGGYSVELKLTPQDLAAVYSDSLRDQAKRKARLTGLNRLAYGIYCAVRKKKGAEIASWREEDWQAAVCEYLPQKNSDLIDSALFQTEKDWAIDHPEAYRQLFLALKDRLTQAAPEEKPQVSPAPAGEKDAHRRTEKKSAENS